ncbi:hypothetical protein ACLB2K_074608 [Fragaria x ananassa]
MVLFLVLCLLALSYAFSCLCNLVLQRRDQWCYLLAYECYEAPEDMKLNTDTCVKTIIKNKNLGLDEFRFLIKISANSRIGEETSSARNIIQGRADCATQEDSLSDMDGIIFDTLDKLFAKDTTICPSKIDILVVNVSMFSPAPSLTSRMVNHYRMREDIKTFNISGMGCSASLVAIDVVHNLFKTHKDSFAIVVRTESIGPNWYAGKDKSMMLPNCLFRSGGCSMLFTNRRSLRKQAILKMKYLIRTHMGSRNEAYECCMRLEDESGYGGVRLTKHLKKEAALALTTNLQKSSSTWWALGFRKEIGLKAKR